MAGLLYRQIADRLRRLIESGELKAGMQNPHRRSAHGATPYVPQHRPQRLRELTTRGLVYTLHGKGTYASERVAPIVITLTIDPETGRGGGEGLV
jgi:DNA-binding GntR family transcriptional regulator